MKIKNIDPYHRSLFFRYTENTLIIYLVMAYPCLIALTLITYIGFKKDHPDSVYWFYIYAPITAITTLCIIITITIQRSRIKAFKDNIKKNNFFHPSEPDECMTFSGSRYLGIDVNKGFFIFISHVKTNFTSLFNPRDYIVMGFSINDYESITNSGSELIIYTGKPDIPRLFFTNKRAVGLYHKIAAMNDYDYHYSHNIPDYVNNIAKQVAEEKNLNLIMSRFS